MSGFSFKVVKNVTLPLFKLEKNKDYYFRFEGPIHTGKDIKGKSTDDRKQPAELAKVTNLETGELGEIICPMILRETMQEDYPDDGYVGKCFALSLTRPEGKAYNLVSITEIEVTATAEPTSAPASEPAQAPTSKGGKTK